MNEIVTEENLRLDLDVYGQIHSWEAGTIGSRELEGVMKFACKHVVILSNLSVNSL